MNPEAQSSNPTYGSYFEVKESVKDARWVEKRLDPDIHPDPEAFSRTFKIAKEYLGDFAPEYEIVVNDDGSILVRQERIIPTEVSNEEKKLARARSLDRFLERLIAMYEGTFERGDGTLPEIRPTLEDTGLIFGRSALRPDETPRFYAVDLYPLMRLDMKAFAEIMYKWIDVLEGIAYEGRLPESELKSPRVFERALQNLSQKE